LLIFAYFAFDVNTHSATKSTLALAFTTSTPYHKQCHLPTLSSYYNRVFLTQRGRLNTILYSEKLRQELSKFTVKELKEKIKNQSDSSVKISSFKLKADMINFLIQQSSIEEKSSSVSQQSPSDGNRLSQESLASVLMKTVQSPQSTLKKTRNIRKMPSLQPLSSNSSPSSNSGKSAKDLIFETVMNQYPPLRDLQEYLESQEKGNQNSSTMNNNNDYCNLMFTPNYSRMFTGVGELDIRQKYHPMLANMTSSDLDIITVGTASCVPSVTRGVSCTALRLQWRKKTSSQEQNESTTTKSDVSNAMVTGGIWIFDCGECTQLQIQRSGSIKPGKITKIFITHSHGDHSFGLPGLLCLMGQDRDHNSPPLEIYGPEGLRKWLRTCVRYSISRIVPPYRVHELMDIPMAPEWAPARIPGRYFYQLQNKRKIDGSFWGSKGLAGEDPVSWISRAPTIPFEPSSQFGEIPGGRDIYPIYDHPMCVNSAPIWLVEDEGDVKVYAAPMSHGVPCVGYVVEEESKKGRLRDELVLPIVKRNLKGLKDSGMRTPMKVMSIIKDLPRGESYTFPDGTILNHDDVVEPDRKGRKIVICGDTADARAIARLGEGADVLIHEATNTYLAGIDKDTTPEEVTKDARIHGHSTPYTAGNFAKQIGAKRLVLHHFSSRYKGDQSLESISIMTRIEQQAIRASELDENKVCAAWDLMILPVPQNK
jgi:ribonuclease Z